jgi:hypothetical protein
MLSVSSNTKRPWEAGGLAWGARGTSVTDQHSCAWLVKAGGLSQSSLRLLYFHLLRALEKKPFFLSVFFNYRTVAINYQVSSSLGVNEGIRHYHWQQGFLIFYSSFQVLSGFIPAS